jgi:predicted Co/Zn/Cd cation transporter (cation efflux family)
MYSNLGSISSANTVYAAVFPSSWGGAGKSIAIAFDAIYSINDCEVGLDERTRMGF